MKRIFVIDENFKWQYLKNNILSPDEEHPIFSENENEAYRFTSAEIQIVKKMLVNLNYQRISIVKIPHETNIQEA